jgi:hypothetical protein
MRSPATAAPRGQVRRRPEDAVRRLDLDRGAAGAAFEQESTGRQTALPRRSHSPKHPRHHLHSVCARTAPPIPGSSFLSALPRASSFISPAHRASVGGRDRGESIAPGQYALLSLATHRFRDGPLSVASAWSSTGRAGGQRRRPGPDHRTLHKERTGGVNGTGLDRRPSAVATRPVASARREQGAYDGGPFFFECPAAFCLERGAGRAGSG